MGYNRVRALDRKVKEQTSGGEFWVSRTRGSDSFDGSRETPFATIQKAIDASVAKYGHQFQKIILVEAKTRSRRDIYAPFFCNTRNITIRGVGGIAEVSANYSALGDDPGTVDSANCTVFTNMTAQGFSDFVADGGIDYTFTSNTFTWTGGDLFGRELDTSLQTSGTGTVSWSAYYPNIILENLAFRRLTTATGYGTKTPSCAFVFGGQSSGDTVEARNISLTNCFFYGATGKPSLFMNNVTVSRCVNSFVDVSGDGAVEMNCSNMISNIGSDSPRSGASPHIWAKNDTSGIAGLKSNGAVAAGYTSPCGIHLQYTGSSAAYLVGNFRNLDSGSTISVSGSFRLDNYCSFETSGPIVMNNSYGMIGVIHKMNCYGSYTQTAGLIHVLGGTINGNTVLNGGTFRADNLTIRGNLTVANGVTIDFVNVTVLGTVTLGSTTTVTRWKGGAYYGTLTDGGSHSFPAAGTLMNK